MTPITLDALTATVGLIAKLIGTAKIKLSQPQVEEGLEESVSPQTGDEVKPMTADLEAAITFAWPTPFVQGDRDDRGLIRRAFDVVVGGQHADVHEHLLTALLTAIKAAHPNIPADRLDWLLVVQGVGFGPQEVRLSLAVAGS